MPACEACEARAFSTLRGEAQTAAAMSAKRWVGKGMGEALISDQDQRHARHASDPPIWQVLGMGVTALEACGFTLLRSRILGRAWTVD